MRGKVQAFATDFLAEYLSCSVDQNWQRIEDCLNKTMTECIPTRKAATRKNHRPWINRELRRKIRRKARLYKKARKSQRAEDWVYYKAARKQCSKDTLKAKNDYVNEKIMDDLEHGNTKPFWRFIKHLQFDIISIPPIRHAGQLLTNSIEKAGVFGAEFQSVFTREDLTCIPWLGCKCNSVIPPLTITEVGVKKLLDRLKPQKASGPDRIPNHVLKELSDVLSPVLSAVFNQSVTAGEIPLKWKHALVAPVYKKEDKHLASNYRPVSLTVVCCKLLEHCVCNHILQHLEDHNLLTSLQHGFRRRHSCETQLLLTYDDLIGSFDRKIQTDMAILDFSRAFDTVPHERLLGKLASYGVRGILNDWVRSFLSGRTMTVVVDGEESAEPINVLSGVPQGTVLGPLLFLVYINDITDQVSPGTLCRLFADDCLLYRPIHSLEDQLILQRDLDALQRWTELWGMRFNPKKCYIMHVRRAESSKIPHFYELCDTVLLSVTDSKYLGIRLSEDLGWGVQVDAACKKANTKLHFIQRNLKSAPKRSRELAFQGLVRSGLDYCSTVWDPHHKRDINRLEMVNRRGARVVFNKRWRDRSASPMAMLGQLGWSDLTERRRKARLVMTYKIKYGLVAIPGNRFAPRPDRLMRHDHDKKIGTTRSSHNTPKNSFFRRTVLDWNALSQETVDAPSLEAFKHRLRAP